MIGTSLLHYEITAKLGEGGMGEVYRARDGRLGRDVAIKVLPEAFLADAERLARFEREAQMLASLNHPNIGAIYGLEEAEGIQALVMELVEGPTLAERLERGALPPKECLSVAHQMAEALEEAHEKGIIHRDLKPQNIKVSLDGKVKILDFGLAKAMGPTTESPSLEEEPSAMLENSPTLTAIHGTKLGGILGTAAYMAPEQARGGGVDRRADIWAFGVLLYEMLSGEGLFTEGSVVDTLSAVMRKEIDLDRLPPSTPPRLRELVRRCLEREPRKRLRDIGDARIQLEELGEDPDAGGALSSVEAGRFSSRKVLLTGAVVAGALAIGLFIGRGTTPALQIAAESAGNEADFHSFTRLTYQSGLESSPSLSPDGEFVAYTAIDGGDRDIFLLRVSGQRSINLTEESTFDEDHAAFSPDGRHLAFRSERDGGGIFVMGATGESVRRLSDFGDNPYWSPDGSTIVFATEGESDPHARERVSNLWTVPADGGEPIRIFEEDAVIPTWSPSGHRIAYWTVFGGAGIRNVETVAADGSDRKPVTAAPSVDWNPVWGHDGRHLYFVSDRGGVSSPWRVALDEETGELLGEPQPIFLPTGWAGQLSFSQDGRHLVYRTGEMTAEVSRLPFDPDSGELTGPAERLFQTAIPAVGLDVAADGNIVFRTVAMQEDIYVLKVDGSGLRKLTDDLAKDRSPVWSPDGSEIAFYSNRSGNYEIWTIDRDGSRLRQRTQTPQEESAYFPIWSPDGRSIAFGGTFATVNLFELQEESVPYETMEVLPIDEGDGETVLPMSWSPDGGKIAGVRISYNGQLMDGMVFFDLASKETQWVTIPPPGPPSGSTFPTLTWLPDSRRGIVRWADRLLLIDTKTETVTLLLDGLNRDGGIARASDDGRWIYMIDSREEGDLWLASREP